MHIFDARGASRMKRTFLQLEKSSLTAHRNLIRKSPVGAEILSLIWEHMDEDNSLVASQATIAEILGVNQSTVSRAVKVLIDGQWVQRIRIGGAYAFVINSAVVWQKARNQKMYARFKATVLASATEQTEAIKKLSELKLKRMPRRDETDSMVILDDEDPPSQQEMDLMVAPDQAHREKLEKDGQMRIDDD